MAKLLPILLALTLTACSQGALPPAPVSTVVDIPTTATPTPAAPCRLLAVWDADGRTHATIGPRCPQGEWVAVVNLTTGSRGSSVVEGWPAQITAGATAPGLVMVSGGVSR